MDYQKVKPGDDLVISSELWNLLIQMASDYKGAGSNISQPSAKRPAVPIPTDVVLIKNTTTDNIPRYSIMYADSSLIEPTGDSANLPEFQRRTVLHGIKPTANAVGRWGVLLDSLTPDQVGRIAMVGVVQCQINLVTVADKFVESAADSYTPNSSSAGSAQILYVAGGVGTATATGVQWAILKLGSSATLPVPQYQWMVIGAISQGQLGAFFTPAVSMSMS